MIRFEHVFKKYSGSRRGWVLEDLSLEIGAGEIVFLLGPSGAGKTTLLKLLTLEERPTSGWIQVQGFDSRTIKRKQIPELRRRCGVVYQDFRLIRDKTVQQNVAYVLQMTGILDSAILGSITRRVLAEVALFAKRNDWAHVYAPNEPIDKRPNTWAVRYGDQEWKQFLEVWAQFMVINGEMQRLFDKHMEKLGTT